MISYPALSHARNLVFQGSYWSLKSSVGEENVSDDCVLHIYHKIGTVFAEKRSKWQVISQTLATVSHYA